MNDSEYGFTADRGAHAIVITAAQEAYFRKLVEPYAWVDDEYVVTINPNNPYLDRVNPQRDMGQTGDRPRVLGMVGQDGSLSVRKLVRIINEEFGDLHTGLAGQVFANRTFLTVGVFGTQFRRFVHYIAQAVRADRLAGHRFPQLAAAQPERMDLYPDWMQKELRRLPTQDRVVRLGMVPVNGGTPIGDWLMAAALEEFGLAVVFAHFANVQSVRCDVVYTDGDNTGDIEPEFVAAFRYWLSKLRISRRKTLFVSEQEDLMEPQKSGPQAYVVYVSDEKKAVAPVDIDVLQGPEQVSEEFARCIDWFMRAGFPRRRIHNVNGLASGAVVEMLTEAFARASELVPPSEPRA